jgi:hypothetical protein
MTNFEINNAVSNNTTKPNLISVPVFTGVQPNDIKSVDLSSLKQQTYEIKNAKAYQIAKSIDYTKLRQLLIEVEHANFIASGGKFSWQSSTAYQLIANSFVKICNNNLAIAGNRVYIRNEFDMLSPIAKVSEIPWAQIINPMLETNISATAKTNTINEIIALLNKDSSSQNVIQFLDSYIKDDVFYEGIYDDIVDWVIPYKAMPFASSRKFTKPVQEVDDTFNFITNYDPAGFNYMFNLLGTMFMTKPGSKAKYGAKMLNLYGQTGSNGKSLTLSLISDTINGTHVSNFPTQSNTAGISMMMLKDKNYTSSFINKLFVFDADLTKGYLPETISDILKKYTAGDETTIEAKYENAVTVRPAMLLAMASNEQIKSSDKSGGIERRMSWFSINKKFPHDVNVNPADKKFFDNLFSEEAAQYIFELILNGYINVIELGSLIEPDSVKQNNTEMNNANNSAQSWITDFDEKNLICKTVDELYTQYCVDLQNSNEGTPVNKKNWWFAVSKQFPNLIQRKLKLKSKKSSPVNKVTDYLPYSDSSVEWFTTKKTCHTVSVILPEEMKDASLKDIKDLSFDLVNECYDGITFETTIKPKQKRKRKPVVKIKTKQQSTQTN